MSFLRNTTGEIKILWKVIVLVLVVALVCTGGILLIQGVLVPEVRYAVAMDQLEAGNVDEALRVLESLNGYGDSREQINSVKYDIAMQLLKSGKYSEAAQAFRALGNYKDSRKQASNILFAVQKDGLVDLQAGETLFFGHYEQDNNLTNGTEELEWVVLDVVDGKALVTTVYAVDSMMYLHILEDVTWEQSSIRQWLNEDFYKAAFETEHRDYIALTQVPADLNPQEDTLTGPVTEDYLFLLSLKEIELYMVGKPLAVCSATPYVVNNRFGYVFGENDASWWWSRTSGGFQNFAAGVNPIGVISYQGNNVTYHLGGIRPAMWIDLNV